MAKCVCVGLVWGGVFVAEDVFEEVVGVPLYCGQGEWSQNPS